MHRAPQPSRITAADGRIYKDQTQNLHPHSTEKEKNLCSCARRARYDPAMEHKHLKRIGRIWITNPRYFITTCVDHRKPVLTTNTAAKILRSEWEHALEHHGWAIGSYVIMPDHVHFFCTEAEQRVPLSAFIGKWKEWTSKRLKRECNIDSFRWQKSFFDHLLRSSESYSEKWEYVRKNPVRAELVQHADEWPYSGHVHYK